MLLGSVSRVLTDPTPCPRGRVFSSFGERLAWVALLTEIHNRGGDSKKGWLLDTVPPDASRLGRQEEWC